MIVGETMFIDVRKKYLILIYSFFNEMLGMTNILGLTLRAGVSVNNYSRTQRKSCLLQRKSFWTYVKRISDVYHRWIPNTLFPLQNFWTLFSESSSTLTAFPQVTNLPTIPYYRPITPIIRKIHVLRTSSSTRLSSTPDQIY